MAERQYPFDRPWWMPTPRPGQARVRSNDTDLQAVYKRLLETGASNRGFASPAMSASGQVSSGMHDRTLEGRFPEAPYDASPPAARAHMVALRRLY